MREQAHNPDRITSRSASRILGCSVEHLIRLADDGALTTWQVPGAWVWFSRKEIEALAQRSFRPAHQTAGSAA